MMVILFWCIVTYCTYAYVGYPLLLLLARLFVHRPVKRDESYTPAVTVIVPAYNEERVIAAKLDNLLEQNYPATRLEVLVASDGSTDGTNAIVEEYARRDPRVQLLKLPRGGKAAALNAAAARSSGEVLVFTDANAMLAPGALRRLIASMADPLVGGAGGNQRYKGSSGGGAGRGEKLYWQYDKWLKKLETDVGNTISADGSLYAVRRSLYVPIADPSATDDFAVSTKVITQGYRLVYVHDALVFEGLTGSPAREFRRKVRIINRGMRSLLGLGSFLLPWKGGFYSLQVLSHKLMRRLVPFLLPVLLILNAMLWSAGSIYRIALVAQVLFYTIAAVGFVLRNTRLGSYKIFFVPYYFCQANLAAALGVLNLLRHRRVSLWEPHRVAGA